MNMMDGPIIEDFGAAAPARAPGIDPRRLLRRVWRGMPILVVCLVMGIVAGAVLLRVLQPTYTSSVSILIDPKRPGSYGADAQFASIYVDTSKIASVEVLLLSSGLLERVVKSQHLENDPDFGDPATSMTDRLLPFLSPHKPAPRNTPEARVARAVERLRRIIRTERLGNTYVIKVDVRASDADGAQRIARSLADAYLAEQTETKFDAARRDGAWLTDRLADQRKQLITSEVAVETLRKKFGVVGGDNGLDSSTDRASVAQINDELVKAEAEVAAAQARFEQGQRVLRDGGNIEGLPDIAASHVIQDLRKQQAETAERVAELSVRYGTDYPTLKQALSNNKAVERQVQLEISRVIASLSNDYQTALAHRDALAAQLAKMMGVVNTAANAEGRVELREAERLAEANRIAYEASLNKLREVQQQETRQDAEARVISGPDLPEKPSFPKPVMLLPAGAAFGLLVGLGLVLVLPITRDQVEDAGMAERDLLLPVLAMTPFVRQTNLLGAGRPMTIPEYLSANPFSGFAESLRLLRLRLRAHKRDGGQVVQVTSAIPGEGKSTIAASLAISAAAAGARTVLVDLDLHHPAAGNLLRHEHGEGVVDILLGHVGPEAALQTHDHLPIRIINAGSIASLRPGMIESAELRALIQGLARDFDLIVIDTPPVLAICDPLYISSLVDTTVMVVAWRSTPQECVNDALAALRAAGAPLAGILLNKVQFGRFTSYNKDRYGYAAYATA